MTSRATRIARAVLQQFDKLPAKRKPAVRVNGIHEWVPLSGIVAEKGDEFTCVALATGMKCLPSVKLPLSKGVAIHDWHAEILAIRTFNRFLLDECRKIIENDEASNILAVVDPKAPSDGSNVYHEPFRILDDVKLHMYCSEAPCGDASMELIMAAQEDATPWDTPTPSTGQSTTPSEGELPGRAYFSRLGIVRRKPARGDAPPSGSKSCSDKLSLKQCTSLLSSLTSLFVSPANAYIDKLIIPKSQYSAEACQRAFSSDGRMRPLAGRRWARGYAFRPFHINVVDLEFRHSRIVVQEQDGTMAPSNLAAAWSLSGIEESISGGVVQGRKAFDERGASRMSRKQMWAAARELVSVLGTSREDIEEMLFRETYGTTKEGTLLEQRRQVKADVINSALRGWTRNQGDSDFTLVGHRQRQCQHP